VTPALPADVRIRRATDADVPALGRLGASLLTLHYAYDPQRFMAPSGHPEEGYAWFLGSQLREDDVVIFVAERKGDVVGYVYAGLEPQSWKELREAAGFVHDVLVDESHRRSGIAAALPMPPASGSKHTGRRVSCCGLPSATMRRSASSSRLGSVAR